MIFNYFEEIYLSSAEKTVIALIFICTILAVIVIMATDKPTSIKDFEFYTKIQITTSSEVHGKVTNYYVVIDNQKKFKTQRNIYNEINIINSLTLFDIAINNKKSELVAIQISR